MKLKIVNKSTNALPEYKTPDSSGMDLRAYLPEGSITLAPMERKIIPTGLYMEIEQGYEGQVRPRSGCAVKQGLTVINAPGTIDADYRGEVGVPLINLSRTTDNRKWRQSCSDCLRSVCESRGNYRSF